MQITLTPLDNQRLARLCGHLDEHIQLIQSALNLRIQRRGGVFQMEGPEPSLVAARELIYTLYEQNPKINLGPHEVQLHLARYTSQTDDALPAESTEADHTILRLRTRRSDLAARTSNQKLYLQHIIQQDLTLGVGPAGTGKTFLAVACAVDALERNTVQRLILTRPAVEAGERLGFLPGDLAQKVDPYLRPLYDALYDLMGIDRVTKAFERHQIEIAPLAFMRGRTLNNAFVILDEAQNTTPEQMKMFLTRIGFGSRVVVTGDTSQIDLPKGMPSGLIQALDVLNDIPGVGITKFDASDVVRHPLVARIVRAYEKAMTQDRPNKVQAS